VYALFYWLEIYLIGLKTKQKFESIFGWFVLYRTSRVKGSQPAEKIRRDVKRRECKRCA
jgi:hypothetical protein